MSKPFDALYSIADLKKHISESEYGNEQFQKDTVAFYDHYIKFLENYNKKIYSIDTSVLTLETKINRDNETLLSDIKTHIKINLIDKLDKFLKETESRINGQELKLSQLLEKDTQINKLTDTINTQNERIAALEQENQTLKLAILGIEEKLVFLMKNVQ